MLLFFWFGFGFLDSLNFFSSYLKTFHDFNLLFLILLVSFIFLLMFNLLTSSFMKTYFQEPEFIEISWTLVPCFILIILGWPSLQLLYNLDNLNENSNLTLKVTGHQWYWNYNYDNLFNLNYDSFMILDNDLKNSDFRLLETDNKVVLPMNSLIRVLITSSDVLHSWALPSMGVKADANPGRLNQTFMMSLFPGVFYGQCSELCGVNHAFMPISVEFTSYYLFFYWMKFFHMTN